MGSKYGLDKAVPGPNAYVEGRINLFDTPWDLGVQTSFGSAFRKQGDKRYDSSNKFGIEVFTDYNFRSGIGSLPSWALEWAVLPS